MKLFLMKEMFKPCAVLISIVLLPIIVFALVIYAVTLEFKVLIALLGVMVLWILVMAILHLVCSQKKYYLEYYDNVLKVIYPNVNLTSNELNITKSDIVELVYYKMFSIRSWLATLPYYNLPQCVFLTYKNNGVEVCVHIGYMSNSEVNELSRLLNVRTVYY